jgi:hypothetical protein
MVLVVYAILAGAVAWGLARRRHPWILERLDEPGRQRVRVSAAVPIVLVGMAGFAVIGLAAREGTGEVLPWLIGLAAIGGSILYGVGLLSWWGGTAFVLRLMGWLLMAFALAIPSTLTLALPLVALLVPALVAIGRDPTAGWFVVGDGDRSASA